jgi:hypothetical protein
MWHWLTEVPLALIWAYSTMLPRLSAEEALQQSTIAAVGGGTMKKETHEKTVRGWQRQMHGKPAADPKPRRKTGDELKAAGFKVFGPKKKTPAKR